MELLTNWKNFAIMSPCQKELFNQARKKEQKNLDSDPA